MRTVLLFSSMLILAIGVMGVMPNSSLAAKLPKQQWYVGGSVGKTDIDTRSFDDSIGAKVYAGYNVNRFVAFEGALTSLGEFDSKTVPGFETQVIGIEASLIGKIPIGRFSIFAKAGFFFWDVENSQNGAFVSDDDGVDGAYGGGFEYRFRGHKDRWSMRGEWQRFKDISNRDIDMLSFGIKFGFGSRKK